MDSIYLCHDFVAVDRRSWTGVYKKWAQLWQTKKERSTSTRSKKESVRIYETIVWLVDTPDSCHRLNSGRLHSDKSQFSDCSSIDLVEDFSGSAFKGKLEVTLFFAVLNKSLDQLKQYSRTKRERPKHRQPRQTGTVQLFKWRHIL